MTSKLMSRPEQVAGLVFLGFLLVVLNVVIDHRAIDYSLIPRLLALLVFLVIFLGAVFTFDLDERWDLGVLSDPVVLCYAAYFVLTSLSLVMAVNVTAGFTDVFRTAGALTVLCLACLIFGRMAGWPVWLARCAVVAAFITGGLGYYDLLTQLGFGLHDRQLMQGVMGLMSNVNLYAGFLNLLLPMCLAGLFVLRGLWRTAAGVACLGLVLMVVLLQTRAAYLGLAAGVAAGVLCTFLFSRQLGLGVRLRNCLLVGGLAVTTGTALFIALADGNIIAERIRTIFEGGAKTSDGGRLVIWGLTLQMAWDHLFTGVGAGNFTVRLHDYYDIDNPDFSLIHPNWVRPHNDFLWVLAEKGVFGFAAFVGIFFFAVRNLFRALANPHSSQHAWTALFVAAALVAYATGSFFDFPQERVTHQVWLSVYLAASVVLGRPPSEGPTRGRLRPPRNARRLTAVVCSVPLLLGIFYSAVALRQEWLVIRARTNLANDDHESMVQNARAAASRWKDLDAFATPVVFLEGLGLMFLARHDEALTCFERARAQMPSRIYITKHIGLLSALRRDYTRAIEAFSSALQRSPENVDTITRLAMCFAETGDPARALIMLQGIPSERIDENAQAALSRVRRMLTDTGARASGDPQDAGKINPSPGQ